LHGVGFPETPILLPEDEAEIAEPFGCKNLDEVAYVLHMDSKRQLLKELSKTDPKSLATLMGRIDFSRMEDKLGILHDAEHAVDKYIGHESIARVMTVGDIDRAASRLGINIRNASTQWNLFSWLSCSSCTNDAHSTIMTAVDLSSIVLSEPLLAQQCEIAPLGPSRARLLNEQLVRAVRAKDREAVLNFYREEDPNLLYLAYEDLFEMLHKDELDAFEKEWEGLIAEEEFMELTKDRPSLKVAFLKMMAYRTKKAIFG